MSNSTKIVTLIVVVVIIIGGILWYSSASGTSSDVSLQAPVNSSTTKEPVTQTSQTQQTDTVSASNSSDASINQDTANIDTQMNSLDSANANSNQPVQ